MSYASPSVGSSPFGRASPPLSRTKLSATGGVGVRSTISPPSCSNAAHRSSRHGASTSPSTTRRRTSLPTSAARHRRPTREPQTHAPVRDHGPAATGGSVSTGQLTIGRCPFVKLLGAVRLGLPRWARMLARRYSGVAWTDAGYATVDRVRSAPDRGPSRRRPQHWQPAPSRLRRGCRRTPAEGLMPGARAAVSSLRWRPRAWASRCGWSVRTRRVVQAASWLHAPYRATRAGCGG